MTSSPFCYGITNANQTNFFGKFVQGEVKYVKEDDREFMPASQNLKNSQCRLFFRGAV